MTKFDKKTICKLINAAIEDETQAGREYSEILKVIPLQDEFDECSKEVVKIMEDEMNHALILIKIGEKLGCEEPHLSKDDQELIELSKHIYKIKLKI